MKTTRRQRLNPHNLGLTDVIAQGTRLHDSQLLVNQPGPEDVDRLCQAEDAGLVAAIAAGGLGVLACAMWRMR